MCGVFVGFRKAVRELSKRSYHKKRSAHNGMVRTVPGAMLHPPVPLLTEVQRLYTNRSQRLGHENASAIYIQAQNQRRSPPHSTFAPSAPQVYTAPKIARRRQPSRTNPRCEHQTQRSRAGDSTGSHMGRSIAEVLHFEARRLLEARLKDASAVAALERSK